MPKDFQERISAREAEIAEKQDFELDIIADLIAYIETLSE
jgi:hypothetical protein